MNKFNQINVDENYSITHSDCLKEKKFLNNTILEYRISRYLQKIKPDYKVTLYVDLVQNNGDFKLGDKNWELKENRGALSSGYISLEIINTRKKELSGLLKSVKDGVDRFSIYLPTYKTYTTRYKSLVNNLLIFKTEELYNWVISQNEIKAENNKETYSNALCYKIPVKYVNDSVQFKSLYNKVIIDENELENIKVPSELYNLFQK